MLRHFRILSTPANLMRISTCFRSAGPGFAFVALLSLVGTPTVGAQQSSGIAGEYDVRGSNPGGTGAYRGNLLIQATGDTYRFTWGTGGASTVIGIGIRRGDAIVVAYGDVTCGAVLYGRGANNSLVGNWSTSGNTTVGSEIAVPVPNQPLGEFTVMGTNPGGGTPPYRGKMTFRVTGPTFTMRWDVGERAYAGIGVRLGEVFGVAYGAASCAVALYDIASDGSLKGAWALRGQTDVGTETATRR